MRKTLLMVLFVLVFCFAFITAMIADEKSSGLQAGMHAFITQWGGFGLDKGKFDRPYGIAIDNNGNVYVTEMNNARVQKFDTSGKYIAIWYGPGGEKIHRTKTKQVSYDKPDNNFGVNRINFYNPSGIAVDNEGFVYVVDSGNHSCEKFGSGGSLISKWGDYGENPVSFSTPMGVAADSNGNIYVTDSTSLSDCIKKFDTQGDFLTGWCTMTKGSENLGAPSGLCTDKSGNLYIADAEYGRIVKCDPDGKFLRYYGSSGNGKMQFNSPEGVTVDNTGNIYVSDTGNNRVVEFDQSGNLITSWGGVGKGNGQFNSPEGITMDKDGNIYVVDSGNNRIEKFAK